MKRILIFLLCASFLMTCLTGCRGEDKNLVPELAQVRQSGSLRIGVMVCPPFTYCVDDVWSGFDIALASDVCAKLGVAPEFVEINWSDKIAALKNGDVDCLWCSLTVDDSMTEELAYSQPYLVSRPVLITRTDSMDFGSIAAEQNSGTMQIVKAYNTGAQIIPAASCTEAVSMVEDGRADCAVTDVLYASAMTSSLVEIRWDVDLGSQQFAAAFRHDSDLVLAVNKALGEMEQSGALSNLAERYHMADSLIMG